MHDASNMRETASDGASTWINDVKLPFPSNSASCSALEISCWYGSSFEQYSTKPRADYQIASTTQPRTKIQAERSNTFYISNTVVKGGGNPEFKLLNPLISMIIASFFLLSLVSNLRNLKRPWAIYKFRFPSSTGNSWQFWRFLVNKRHGEHEARIVELFYKPQWEISKDSPTTTYTGSCLQATVND